MQSIHYESAQEERLENVMRLLEYTEFYYVMTSGWVIEPYRYKEKLLMQITYLVQVGVVVGGVKHDVH